MIVVAIIATMPFAVAIGVVRGRVSDPLALTPGHLGPAQVLELEADPALAEVVLGPPVTCCKLSITFAIGWRGT